MSELILLGVLGGGGSGAPRRALAGDACGGTAATVAVSKDLFVFDQDLGVSRPKTKYPVRGIPHVDYGDTSSTMWIGEDCRQFAQHLARNRCRGPGKNEDW